MFSLQWERLKRPLADGPNWVAERLQRHGTLPDGLPPAAEHFSACGWAHGMQTEEDKQTTYWYGYAAPAGLVLGVTVNGVLPAAVRAQITGPVLSSLRATPTGADSIWSMYDVSFVAPAGFELAQRHLFSGDVALEFQRGRRETLLLRQVYPGDLALGRRSFERWLGAYPFKEHRRLRPRGLTIEPWPATARAELTGLRRRGRKRLGVPLGGLAPRWTYAVAAHDRDLNRLLIAEHLTVTEPDEAVCVAAIERMNQPLRGRS
jgi:hypothetical protein